MSGEWAHGAEQVTVNVLFFCLLGEPRKSSIASCTKFVIYVTMRLKKLFSRVIITFRDVVSSENKVEIFCLRNGD